MQQLGPDQRYSAMRVYTNIQWLQSHERKLRDRTWMEAPENKAACLEIQQDTLKHYNKLDVAAALILSEYWEKNCYRCICIPHKTVRDWIICLEWDTSLEEDARIDPRQKKKEDPIYS